MDWSIVVGYLVGAIGAALAVGTGLALLRYWRTGRFPGQPEGADASLVSAWVKLGLGAAMVVWGVATLDRAGMF